MAILTTLLGLGLIGAGAMLIAVKRNGPAVLDTVDRLAGPSHDVELVHRASYGDNPSQKLLVYRSGSAQEPQPVFVFFHGGAWAHGDPDDYGFVARNMAAQGYVVVLGGYRLNEAGRYPAMLQDTAATVAWVHENIAGHGGDPGRIVLSGHSAGAYNAVQVALEDRWLEEAGAPSGAVRGVVGLSGPYDFYPFDTDRSRAAFGSVGAGAESQPVAHTSADAPPMLLVHGEADTVVKIRNSQALAAQLQEAGASVETLYLPGKTHNDPLLALTNPWRRDPLVFDRIAQFLRLNASLSVPVQAKNP
ncbi:alpha/beta hydrolase [Qipengyuania psychrotolerans]|uniref:Alpha/beta hydrolase n=1 Tax=Qipengyuania psychrotolerans TaxID=2867238 RepID=A0ABX8ZD97_9SPHN|nr:alpha/beta hydrolase [Qipengyuania psychrotolerans]QZD86980.1 alpha/beta hydrolase [Qipengyuania psychrotolerans]